MPLSLKNKVKDNRSLRHIRPSLMVFLFCWHTMEAKAFMNSPVDSSTSSTLQEAIHYLHSVRIPDSSVYWPNIKPAFLMENLNLYVKDPLYAFESKNTNFCGYTAISFITFEKNPRGFIQLMLQLYTEGKATMGAATFEPSAGVRKMAGLLKYKGMLDINPATQMWFLTLADHFKGYLNIFNRHYQAGDENTMWASTNFAKFNRMLRKLFKWKVRANGADLVRPPVNELFPFLEKRLRTGTVFLYLNNRLLYKKRHVATRLGIPTHYVLLKYISKQDDRINIIYMDGGRKTLQQISPALLKQIVFGITWCTDK